MTTFYVLVDSIHPFHHNFVGLSKDTYNLSTCSLIITSNNLNSVMKRLTSITIILSLPILVTSIYGMNVDIPYQHSNHAFYIPVSISLIVSLVISWYFMKKKWF